MSTFSESPFLIIGGTTKAGTTSMYRYLRDHPQVCASTMKETRFFLDPEYPLKSKYRYVDGLENYQEFYRDCAPGQVKMEATPDYLHSLSTPEIIRSNLKNARMLFILRDPVSRLISWFNFSKQIGQLPDSTDLEMYIDLQKNDPNDAQHLMALKQGNYSVFLEEYYKYFSREDILVVFHEDLAVNLKGVMRQICEFSRIDPGFYESYDFQRFNETVGVKNQKLHKIYMQQSFRIRKLVHDKRNVHQALRNIKKALNPVYRSLNERKVNKVAFPERIQNELKEYYQMEYKYFQNEFDSLPWEV